MNLFILYFRFICLVLIIQLFAIADGHSHSVGEGIDEVDSLFNYREPPEEIISKLQSSYNYGDSEEDITSSLFSVILNYFERFTVNLSFSKWMQYLFLGVIVVALIFVVLKYLNFPVSSILGKQKRDDVAGLSDVDQSSKFSLNQLFDNYKLLRDNGAYRESVRLLYDICITNFHYNSIIDIQPYKTDLDYVNEIEDESLKRLFYQFTRFYQYIWFGNFNPDSRNYKRVEELYFRMEQFVTDSK
ncbi:hypothetical protein QA597_04015 [Marinilabiliaceae bacterium ANBcel2]|nr:hypothetical protein [Marinilabiliaceae bacterium ANBcel2]